MPRWLKILVTKYSHFSSRWNPSLNSYSNFHPCQIHQVRWRLWWLASAKSKRTRLQSSECFVPLAESWKNKSMWFGRNNPLDVSTMWMCRERLELRQLPGAQWHSKSSPAKDRPFFAKPASWTHHFEPENVWSEHDYPTISPHTGFARVSLFSFQDVF